MRYPAHALQMCTAYLGQMAPSSYIVNCAAFAAADLLRLVSLVAYRTRQFQTAHPSAGFGTNERSIWESHPHWQGTRRAVETTLIAYDWGECFTAVNLVLRPTLHEVWLRQFANIARLNKQDELLWLLLSNLVADADRAERWSAALGRYAVERRPENAPVLKRWADKWTPRADEAAAGLARMLAELPEDGQEVELTLAAAHAARERVLADAGILVPAA
jgi:toluene monooxygenase system protein E